MREFTMMETIYGLADISFRPSQLVSAGERPVCKMYYFLGMAHLEAKRGDKLHL